MHHRIHRSSARIYTFLALHLIRDKKTTMKAFIPLLGLTLLGLAAAVPAPENERLHEQMTALEVRQLFNAEPHQVPDYHVVPISWPKLHKRSHGSRTRLTVKAFGQNIKLWLNPVDDVLFGQNTPVYFAQSGDDANSAVSFVQIPNAMSVVKEFYEDREKQASLLVERSASGEKLISGHIGALGWIVKPVPERFRRELDVKHRRSAENDRVLPHINYKPTHHVIIKTPEASEEVDHLSQPLRDNILGRRLKHRNLPDIIYPEVLVFVDHAAFKMHNENINDLLKYMVPFWNGVDLTYRQLEKPKVRLNIAGIIVSKDANAFEFIEKNRVGTSKVNIYKTLDALSYYLPKIRKDFSFDSYDLAVIVSGYDMCSAEVEKDCSEAMLGLAYIQGVCNGRGKKTSETLSVAVMQDRGAYDGVYTASHEMGHLFGSEHDGDEGSHCTYEEGHIMASTPVLTSNYSDWSICSIEALDKTFNQGHSDCLHNKPKVTSPLPRILPGQVMTREEQCQRLAGTLPCRGKKQNSCIVLYCHYKEHAGYCAEVADEAPSDGTSCGKNKMCLHSQCVSINEDDDENQDD